MSDVPELDADGLPEELNAFDQILHRGEANPRTRSGIMTLEMLDTTPDWDELPSRFDERLAQGAAVAAEGRHRRPCRRWRRGGSSIPTSTSTSTCAGSGSQSPARCAKSSTWPSSRHSHRWTSPGHCGRRPSSRASKAAGAAVLMHISHAVTDGVGGVEMFANIYDLERDPRATGLAAAAHPAGPVAQRSDAART